MAEIPADVVAWFAAAVLAVGYLLGRTRPVWRARDWAYWALYGRPSTLRVLATFLILPDRWLYAWWNRNAPTPEPIPAPQLGEKWQAILNERGTRDDA